MSTLNLPQNAQFRLASVVTHAFGLVCGLTFGLDEARVPRSKLDLRGSAGKVPLGRRHRQKPISPFSVPSVLFVLLRFYGHSREFCARTKSGIPLPKTFSGGVFQGAVIPAKAWNQG